MYPKASSVFLLELQFYCESLCDKLRSEGRRWVLPEAAARPKCDFYVENDGFGFRGRKQSPRAMLNRGYRKRSPRHQAHGGCGYKRRMPGTPRGAENRTWGSKTQPDVGPCEMALFLLLLGGRIRWLWSQAILNTHGVWQCWWAALLQSGAAGSWTLRIWSLHWSHLPGPLASLHFP